MSPPADEWLQAAVRAAQDEEQLKAWRAVEAQHVVSTARLVRHDMAAQDLLERILEESKPLLPPGSEDLHYLLATPFRYPPLPTGSRFRAWTDPGVYYAGIERRTACAEFGYWRRRFVKESEGLTEIVAAPQTLFQVGVRGAGVDLRKDPLSRHVSLWTHPADYAQTQRLGRAARAERIEIIVYVSVRDPERDACIAVLTPRVFRPKRPVAQETWYLTVTGADVIWRRERDWFVFRFD